MSGLQKLYIKRWMTISLIIIMLLICWNVTLKKTYTLLVLDNNYDAKLAEMKNLSSNIDSSNDQLNELFSKYDKSKLSNETYHNWVLGKISEFCNDKNIIITSFPESEKLNTNGLNLEIINFCARGSYHDLIKLHYFLEKDLMVGKIASANYKSHLDRNNGESSINLVLVIYRIKEMHSANNNKYQKNEI